MGAIAGTAAREAAREVAASPTFSWEALRNYVRKVLVEARSLTDKEAGELSQLLSAMWHIRVEHPNAATEANLVCAALKSVIHPALERKKCDCSACVAKKEGGILK